MAIKVSGTTVINDSRGIVNIASGAITGIQSGGTIVGAGATILNFVGTGNSITASNGIVSIRLAGNVSIGTVPPASPESGNLWYDSGNARLFVYYTDSNSSQWVDTSPFNGLNDIFISGPLLVGSNTPTGTSNQNLQITGGGYLSGNTGIGTTNPQAKIHVVGDSLVTGISTIGLGNTSSPSNSQLSFELTSDTNLRIKVRGSDGILRSADITLA